MAYVKYIFEVKYYNGTLKLDGILEAVISHLLIY